MLKKLYGKLESSINALESWMKERKNLAGLLVGIVILGGLIGCAVWLNQPVEGEVPTSASQMAYEKASVTAVLEDGAVPDYEDAEGRRVGTQELEIRILTGTHKGEIMSLTNYMSALFNVDVEKGDQIIVRIMTDEDGSYYASLFNYNRGIVLGVFVLIFFILLAVLGGKKGAGCASWPAVYSGKYMVCSHPLSHPGHSGYCCNSRHCRCNSGRSSRFAQWIFPKDTLFRAGVCHRRCGSRGDCGTGGKHHPYEWIQHAGGGEPSTLWR